MQALEVFCTCWFTFEVSRPVQAKATYESADGCRNVANRNSVCPASKVATRLLLAPNRRKFFRHPLNIIDMASVAPIYITLFFDLVVGSESELGNLGRLIQVLICPC